MIQMGVLWRGVKRVLARIVVTGAATLALSGIFLSMEPRRHEVAAGLESGRGEEVSAQPHQQPLSDLQQPPQNRRHRGKQEGNAQQMSLGLWRTSMSCSLAAWSHLRWSERKRNQGPHDMRR